MSTDDIAHMPHVVIVESDSGISIVEFDRGLMSAAHEHAQRIAMNSEFNGRVIRTIERLKPKAK
jgi:hypothetical protein